MIDHLILTTFKIKYVVTPYLCSIYGLNVFILLAIYRFKTKVGVLNNGKDFNCGR